MTRLCFADGTWRDAVLGFSARGDLDRPITLRAETPGQVILTGSSRLIIDGKHLVVTGLHFMNGALSAERVVEFTRDCSFCRLTQIAITDYNPDDPSSRYHWVRLNGCHSRVDHCEFRGQTHSGVTLAVDLDGRRTYHLIDHNHFGGRPPGEANGFETIRIGTGIVSATEARVTVAYNYFSRCDGEIEIISNKSNENVYRNNTFVNNQGQLTLRNGHRARVEGNFFFGGNRPDSSGVRIIGEDHVLANNYFTGLCGSGTRGALVISNGAAGNDRYKQVKNALVAFNTFTDCTHNLIIGWDADDPERSLPPVNCTIANNVVAGSHAPLVEVDNEPVDMTWEGNIMFGAEVGIDTSGIQVIDPRLVLAPDGLMRPAPESPVVGAAQGSYPQFSTDMDGQPRPEEAADVGADQRSSARIGARPLRPDDVGPSWRTSVETAASAAAVLQ